MIDVYAAHTSNGVKVPIALEELGVPYRVHRINLGANEQKRPEFLRLNWNCGNVEFKPAAICCRWSRRHKAATA